MADGTSNGNGHQLVTELVAALQAAGGGSGGAPGPTPAQAAIIEQHAELKRALAGPTLVRLSPGPTVSKVAPLTGAVGTSVTIEGEQLDATTLVRIGAGRVESLNEKSGTKLKLTVPADATTGPVTVFTLLGTAIGDEFTVT